MKEVETVGNVNLLILSLDPGKLVDNFVTPFVHAFVSDVHLRVENPKKAEAFLRKNLNRNIHDF